MSWQAKPRPPSPPGPASPPTTGLQAVGHRRLLTSSSLLSFPPPLQTTRPPPCNANRRQHLHLDPLPPRPRRPGWPCAAPCAAARQRQQPCARRRARASAAPSSAWLAVRSPVRSRATAAAAMRQETRASEPPAYLPMAANVLRDAPSRRFVRFARRPVVTRASLELRFDAPSQRLRTRFPEDPTVGSAISSLRRNLVLRGQLRQLVSPPP
ncbi:proline-rich receptor-like protein kinase PERK12 [Iris pallida]|uniref:Proline-rich receptor-like protein kinase PERK12 n=1 Tax=Iris pallida TaxID=29817 RepID=A0AAX6HZV0_IRIPA|nr:proline-rich receptor-like protein kinase PERK12 [Iris pallida]